MREDEEVDKEVEQEEDDEEVDEEVDEDRGGRWTSLDASFALCFAIF